MGSDAEDMLSDAYDSEEDLEWSEEDDDIPMIGAGADNTGCKFVIEEVMGEVVDLLGDKICYKPDNGHVELHFDTSRLPVPTLQALGLTDVLTIVLELIFESPYFGAGSAPRSAVRYIKQEVPPVEPDQQPFPEPDTEQLLTGPLDHDQEAANNIQDSDSSPEPANDIDSDSDDDPMQITKYKRPTVKFVAYQFANIARKQLDDDWPATRHFMWRQAKEWIPHLHKHLSARLMTLGDHCVICDDKQPLPGIKPVACSKYLCSHQFDEIGYGASMDMIYYFPTVADLLISMAASAACNPDPRHRQRFFACPNPPSDFVDDHVMRRGQQDVAIDPNNSMGIKWSELQEVLINLPSVASMVAAKNLQNLLDKHHKHAYRLVRWILSTCRGHVVELQPEEQIEGMGGRQFKLFTNTFERELAFQKLKQQQQGSFYVLHGSPFMKWHSILRTCLQNFSNTPFMTSGAADGAGVYTATRAITSLSYCMRTGTSAFSGYRASQFGQAASCLALVEVAGKQEPSGYGVHVVRNHDAVVARYFFVYSNRGELPNTMDTLKMKIPAWDVPTAAALY